MFESRCNPLRKYRYSQYHNHPVFNIKKTYIYYIHNIYIVYVCKVGGTARLHCIYIHVLVPPPFYVSLVSPVPSLETTPYPARKMVSCGFSSVDTIIPFHNHTLHIIVQYIILYGGCGYGTAIIVSTELPLYQLDFIYNLYGHVMK